MCDWTGANLAVFGAALILGLSAAVARADAAGENRFAPPRTTGNRAVDADSNEPAQAKALPRSGRTITPAKSGKPNQRGSASLLRTIGALLFIVALIVIGSRLLKKHTPRINGGIPPEAMEVLGKRAIDQRQVVHLIRLGSRILVVGGSQQGLQTLAEITDPVEVDYLAGMCRRDESESRFTQGFLALFRRQPVSEPDAGHSGGGYESNTTEEHHNENREPYTTSGPDAALVERLKNVELSAAEQRHA